MEQMEMLRQHLSAEVIKALGLRGVEWAHKPLDWLFRIPTRRFAEVGARFDNWAQNHGFAEAAHRILPVFAAGYRAHGAENVPSRGPLLVASNHPGACDSLVIAASVHRDDIKIVTGDIPFLMNLPSASKNMFFASMDSHQRMGVLRSAIRHLRDGGSVLIFPSGTIDPDPAVLPGASRALQDWSRSIEVMLRRAPETRLLVTIVSGVLARACTNSPITRVRKQPRDRQRVAEFIQIMQQMILERSFRLVPDVSFAEPVTLADLQRIAGADGPMGVLVGMAQQLLARHTALAAA